MIDGFRTKKWNMKDESLCSKTRSLFNRYATMRFSRKEVDFPCLYRTAFDSERA